MKLILNKGKKLPRLKALPDELTPEEFRLIQEGREVDVDEGTGAVLIAGGWCSLVEKAKTDKLEKKNKDGGETVK